MAPKRNPLGRGIYTTLYFSRKRLARWPGLSEPDLGKAVYKLVDILAETDTGRRLLGRAADEAKGRE
jgi:hypothetical protein